MEFQHNLVIYEINLITKEVMEKWINPVSSFTIASSIIEHKIYDYLHKDTSQAMFKEKTMAIAPKKDDVAINMVLAPEIIYKKCGIPGEKTFQEQELG